MRKGFKLPDTKSNPTRLQEISRHHVTSIQPQASNGAHTFLLDRSHAMIKLTVLLATLSLGTWAGSPSGENLSTNGFDSTITALAKDSSFLLLDVRTPQEFSDGHLNGAKLVDFHGAEFLTEIGKFPRDAKILLYCRSGNRSGQALKIMKDMGYKDVRHMVGGINAWKAEARPVTN
jgi:rhodanese-related sulfurtransferase